MNIDSDILIVDDKTAEFKLLKDLLEKEGYQVRMLNKPQKAIDSAFQKPPGLILLDVQMDGMDGFELCAHLKQDKRTNHIPIIFICALNNSDARIRGFEAGCVDYITKPIQEQEVLARVKAHMRLQEMQQNLENLVEKHTAELSKKIKKQNHFQQRYDSALAISESGFWDWDVRKNLLFTSDRLKELLGYKPKEIDLTMDYFWSNIHPDDLESVQFKLEKHIKERIKYDIDYRLAGKFGEFRWFHALGQAVWDKEGEAIRMTGSITDITDRKKAESDLLKSEERYQLAVAGSNAGIWDWDMVNNTAYFSDRFKGMLGYSNEDWFITNSEEYSSIMHPEDREINVVMLGKYLSEQKGVFKQDYRLKTKSGAYRWFQVSGQAVWDENGNPIRSAGSLVDIHEQKLAQENINRSEEHFRQLMEQSPMGMELLTPNGKIFRYNRAWRKLWQISVKEAEETISKYNMITDPQLERLGLTDMVKEAFSGKHTILPPIQYDTGQTTEDFDLLIVKHFKSPWIQSHLYPVRNAQGEIEFVVNTYIEITQLKQAEQQVADQREALARVDRAKRMGQLTGSIAHEINQPLTGILSNAQAAELMLMNNRWQTDELANIMSEIASDTKRARDVIRNLRELYRDQKIDLLPIDINSIIDETIKLLHSEFVKFHVEEIVESDPGLPMVHGNAVQVQQVLVNLIMNGIQAMRKTNREDRKLYIKTLSEKNELKVLVEDCGTGIDKNHIDRIFEPLATWKSGGTGMGLAISNSIIEAHGGRMWAENRQECGARVGFILPILKENHKK